MGLRVRAGAGAACTPLPRGLATEVHALLVSFLSLSSPFSAAVPACFPYKCPELESVSHNVIPGEPRDVCTDLKLFHETLSLISS